ncbi:RluA family pseudouridine synthase [Algihabitans albus]|uniref:RluA family pseudouridine synthase n=1 Tax=Algihabitans albus TaxID=2164067 RepID=UPI000E5CA9BA|nr:RluA family pseudouridine synthase [Algihabitans albus]
MSRVETRIVAPGEADQRLDRWFKRCYPGLGHGRLEKLLRTGQIRVDGKRAKANTRLEAGQAIRVPPIERDGEAASPKPAVPSLSKAEVEALRASVLHRDARVLALNKPAGLAVQGGPKQAKNLDALLDLLTFGADERPRLVHRLDRDTSGVLLLARTVAAARALTGAFKQDDARKLYWALVVGKPPKARGLIRLALDKRGGPGGEKVRVDEAGKQAETRYAVIAAAKGITWLLLNPLTGRTHQLRVHCAALGCPILGDGKYGGKAAFPERLQVPKTVMLHARELAVPHPDDGTTLRVQAPLPPDRLAVWQKLGFDPDDSKAANLMQDIETWG